MSQINTFTKEIHQSIEQRLQKIMDEAEARQQAYWLLEALFGKSRKDVVLNSPLQWSEREQEQLEAVLRRLEMHEPIQYVLGEAPFYGHSFRVSPAVLIPRPETEELVQLICSRHSGQEELRLLDIGTGSGCIAVSLALCLPGAWVSGLDLSPAALVLARENARLLQADVRYFKCDILEDYPQELPLQDIIVSNPPYVRRLEIQQMKPNVLEWEPAMALFVEDEDPLLFYRRISDIARQQLKAGGWLYFEINEAYGSQVAGLLKEAGFVEPLVLQDMQGKDRMVQAQWQG